MIQLKTTELTLGDEGASSMQVWWGDRQRHTARAPRGRLGCSGAAERSLVEIAKLLLQCALVSWSTLPIKQPDHHVQTCTYTDLYTHTYSCIVDLVDSLRRLIARGNSSQPCTAISSWAKRPWIR